MDMQPLLDRSGEWLKGEGPASPVAVSSRVRLARNLAGFRFPTRADAAEKNRVAAVVRDALADASRALEWLDVEALAETDRRLLLERHLISRELADGQGPRAVAIDADESLSVMVNEEDHLRLQCLRSGLRLTEAFEAADRLDDGLARRLEYAFDEELGYLTACPTNVGTGMRVSVMLHLPALAMSGQVEKAFRAVHELGLAVRGLYGEGTEALGELYQISNQVTLGRSEREIVGDLEAVIEGLIRYEGLAREQLLAPAARVQVEDRVWRAMGALKNARLMTTEESMKHFSSLRLGVGLGLLPPEEMARVNRLFLLSQPAHLQRWAGKALDAAGRDRVRADFLRQRIDNN
jgi:protein arginine kinase